MTRELVLPQDFSDYAWEVESKGYFDAAVRLGDSLIPVSFYDPVRLQQEIADDIESDRLFTIRRLLVIEVVTVENMKWAVAEAADDFFT
ncbi:hypothetical protein FHJ30_02045 [Arthrobacter sp. BB-1]|uniref:hypothetical protein n=1 Tax=unclassified Arthrobacter TaxID=235627 RepID=UPI0010D2F1CF|nr:MULTISPECIES: hypothetical protein [unclassified Arthrobacter]TNB76374.1 hypothetical protein FHJ30_02045 [Arthrobacter sp. BB-1]VII97679.1 hypothetical protein [Arthrobacter sp. DR-2P]